MNEKFKDLPVEEDTQIIVSVEAKIEDYDVVYQKWHWDGITAESIIFFNDDIAELTEDQIKNEVALCTAMVKENSQMTFKKGEKYTFVNFNFTTE
ncbi:hypothetical protein ESY86_15875 [Subsaximicrobium wynnwilliamsii]|uniref:Uncharacterized protein n=1 Tax=Subsaximicrobium wynnwilliamsii TaxID=291179 RepID=A0A5C6ZD50_9FLAO|nr:hypothetical protein [Subsaximicrobium wynnwilliamsii]TXD82142.1 hypothetical protein ESY87_15465 [Subsaximicrobium wynnwilliamsii]TXD87787.1 hypothetical protein ESY86_15875 [Subsaximicrobium wynnwilliamsii]TXE01598.1 hypothetical protein ESY88_15455 [Subsaximicrobium wynnwilliamsii]